MNKQFLLTTALTLLGAQGSIWAMQVPKIEYLRGELGHNDEFYSNDGWGREPLTAKLGVPGDAIGAMLPLPSEKLSITAMHDKQAIGQRNCNSWLDFIKQLPKNLQEVVSKYPDHLGIQKFAEVQINGLETATTVLLEEFKQKGIALDKVAHNCGLMVLQQFAGQGIGNKLQEESLDMLSKLGFKAVVCETTNKNSASVMKKQGFTFVKAFKYKDLDIDLDDEFTIWYKELNQK